MIDLVEHYRAVKKRIEKRGQEFQQIRNPAPKVLEQKPAFGKTITLIDGPDRPKIAQRRVAPNFRNARSIVEPILVKHDVEWNEVISGARQQKLVKIRQEVMVALRKAGWTLPVIGRFMNRDHTTVLHALRSFKEK